MGPCKRAGARLHASGTTAIVGANTEVMRLYHATDADGVAGIRRTGFAKSHLRDSQESSWFSANPTEAVALSRGGGWFVVVDLPTEVAEPYRYSFEDGQGYLDTFLVPWAVVNEYEESFAYCRAEELPQA